MGNDNKSSPHLQDLVNTEEAAKILDVSTSTLRNWRTQKIFGCYFFTADEKHGNTWYYYRERVEQLKSVYNKNNLQNFYKMLERFEFDFNGNPIREIPVDTPSADFQKSVLSSCTGVPSQIPNNFQKSVLSTGHQPPTHTLQARIPDGFYKPETVAKIIGVSEMTLSRWRDKKIFLEDKISHVGIYLYSHERVLEMKLVCQKSIGKKAHPDSLVNLLASENGVNTPKKLNIQNVPSKIIYFPNDVLAKKLFNLTEDDFKKACQESIDLVEIKKHKKFGKITSPFKIIVDDNAIFTLSEPVDQFDFDVLIICISEYYIGNRYITPAIIYRGLTGKVGTDAMPSKDQLAVIMHSVEKLMRLQIDISMTDYCQKLNCNDGHSLRIVANLLPSEYSTETTINGREATIIHLLAESPIWRIACHIKNHQVLSFKADLLNIPHQQNTAMNIKVKHYVLRRILEIISHNLTATITFADVFKNCRLESEPRVIKLRVREFMTELFEYFKSKELIKDYTINKRGRAFYSISFTYAKPKRRDNAN